MNIFTKENVAVVIPAYNESLVLPTTLEAIQKLVPKGNIFVVDDGSKDDTFAVARKYTENALRISNSGKADALNKCLVYYKIPEKFRYILFMDADTQPAPDFLDVVLPILNSDQNINLVVGRVQSYGNSWIEKYRQWEYQISHFIHKQAQAIMSAIIVVPGCATIYKSEVFKSLKFPSGTLTEDMDFTFLMHRKGFNKMVFAGNALVYTQDPNTIPDFVKQIDRWYTGFWQAVRKHDIPWGGQALDFEAALMALEGLYNGMLAGLILFFLPSLLIFNSIGILKFPLYVDIGLFFIPSLLWVSLSLKQPKLIFYIFHFYFLRFLSSLIFIRSFFRGYLNSKEKYTWDTRRYLLRRYENGNA